jgi:hypothetical protein
MNHPASPGEAGCDRSILRVISLFAETLNHPEICCVAFPDGKPASTSPGNAL